MTDLPIWLQASYVLFYGGIFMLGCVVCLFLLELCPSVYRFLDRLLGGDDA
jgi:hypothetical protein